MISRDLDLSVLHKVNHTISKNGILLVDLGMAYIWDLHALIFMFYVVNSLNTHNFLVYVHV